jgi:hypothetical protein
MAGEHGPQLGQRRDADRAAGQVTWRHTRRRRTSRPEPGVKHPREPQDRGSPGHHGRTAGKAAAALRAEGASDTAPLPNAIGMLNDVWSGDLIKVVWHDGIGMSVSWP